MSSSEDWYPLAPRDLQSSSEDEEAEKGLRSPGKRADAYPAPEDELLGTPAILEPRPAFSPASDSGLSSLAFTSEGIRHEPVDLSDGEELEGQVHPRLRFDEHSDELDTSAGTEQERWQRTDAYMRDVQSAFRSRPAVRVQNADRYNKILLVGEPGLGKDVFIKNAFASYCADNDLSVNSCGPDADLPSFQCNPSDFCTEINIEIDEGRTKIHYMIQDTPGTHIPGAERSILQHVLRQSQEYMAKEQDPKRVVPLSALPDPRVDVCLYFLSPHFLKPQDVALMTKLSELAPVVPIIAKADALTTEELGAYRQQIRERLENISLQIGRPVMHDFAPADLKAAGAVREVPPFAVITSSEVDHEVGSHWFTRTFPWGRCEVLSSNHSDLPALKSLLFEHCFESFKAATEARFYSTRESHLTACALSKALSSGELPDPAKLTESGSLKSVLSSKQSARTPRGSLQQGGVSKPTISKNSVPLKPKAARLPWSWSWSLTLGVVSIAILIQVASLSMYARNTANLKSLVDTYQREAAAEKQVLHDLKDKLEQAVHDKQHTWPHHLPPAIASPNPQAWAALIQPIKHQAALVATQVKALSQAGSQQIRKAAAALSSAAPSRSNFTESWLPDLLSKDTGQGRDVGGVLGIRDRIQDSMRGLVRSFARVGSISQQTWTGVRYQTRRSWQTHQNLASKGYVKAQKVTALLLSAGGQTTTSIKNSMQESFTSIKVAWAAAADQAETKLFRAHRLIRGAKKSLRLRRKAVGRSLKKRVASLYKHIKAKHTKRSRHRLSRWLIRLLAGGALL